MMRLACTSFFAILVQAAPVSAQELSDNMTCDEAIRYYAEHRVINTTENGTVLPITQGTPIQQAGLLGCGADENRFDTMVKTKDKEECVIAAYCD
ncbi:MAG: hypothetical protein LJE67_02855 [Salaquimonas sp.]|nr:hypothetical protein [Salaquimonas sp.]